MATEVGAAYVSVLPQAKGFASKLGSQLNPGLDRSGRESGDRFGRVFASSSIKPLRAVGAAALGLFALDKVKDFFGASFAEARESQKVSAITAQVIKTTGGAAKISAKQVGDLSTAISNKTGIDDEAVQSAANLLLTFKNLRNEVGKNNDVFNQATQIATDMGAALGKEPKAAAIQLGKALNDPVKGISALTRVGVSFTDQQKKQIKALVKSGDTLGAQKIILRELKSEFGGTAAASSTAGEKFSTAFKNLQEQIGTALLPIIDKVEQALTTKIVPAISKFITQMQSGEGAGGKFAAKMRSLGTTLANVGKFLIRNRDTILPFVGALLAVAGVVKVVTTALRVWAVVQGVLNVILTANPIGIVIVAIAALVAGIIIAYKKSETFRKIVKGAFDAVSTAAKFLWTNVIRVYFKLIAALWLTVAGVLINGAAKAFGWVPGIGPKLKAAAAKFNSFRDTVNRALDGVKSVKTISIQTPGMQKALSDLATLLYRTQQVPREVTIGFGNKRAADAKHRAGGGPVHAGTPYIVGEHRPELFVPNQNGTILPSVPNGHSLVHVENMWTVDPKAGARELEDRFHKAAVAYGLAGV